MARPTRPTRPHARDTSGVDRMERVNDLLRDTIAEVVARELKDPRLDSLALLSVTEVRASRDLSDAIVLVSLMPDPEREIGDETGDVEEAALEALRGAAPFIHRTIRRQLHLKRVPWLRFELDPRIAESAAVQARISELDTPANDEAAS